MGAKPYPVYKDSGVEWIGDIPEHWEVKRLKYVVDCNRESLSETTSPFKEIEYIEISDVSLERGIEKFTRYEFSNAPSRARRIVREGDVVFSTVRTYLRAISSVSACFDGMIVSTGFAVLKPIAVEHKYLSYGVVAEYFIALVISQSLGVSYPSIRSEDLLGCVLPSPPIEEQKQIASFLDRETSKIDTLIEKQQQLINLLKEKRGSLISHTVTKGLNPNVPMKDSGVEWIGEIPEHWEVKRLKDVADVSYGVSQITEYVEQGIPILRATNVRSGKFTSVGLVFIRPSDVVPRMISLSDGDIIVVRSGATTGDSAIVTPELVGAIAGFDIVVRSKTIASKFCQYLFLSNYVRKFQWDSSSTRAAQPHLNSHELNGTILTSPPIEEQKQIASFLDRETSKIDTLIEKANQSIALLKERRSCLISAAVTGKIDVRGAV